MLIKMNYFLHQEVLKFDNWALVGATLFKGKKSGHIVTTAFEHSAVLESAKFLEKMGFEVTYISPNELGFIYVNDVVDAIRDDTILVSVMYINNEVGTIQDIKEICRMVKEKNPNILFHTDAVQALSEIEIDVKDLNVDLLSISGHNNSCTKRNWSFVYKVGNRYREFYFWRFSRTLKTCRNGKCCWYCRIFKSDRYFKKK